MEASTHTSPEVDHERLLKLRQEGALRVCEELGVAALLGTQHDNVQYIADVRRFFVYGWEPNSLAVINREGGIKSIDCGAHVAPGPQWADEGAQLKRDTGWDHFTIFNANLIAQRYAKWAANALRGARYHGWQGRHRSRVVDPSRRLQVRRAGH